MVINSNFSFNAFKEIILFKHAGPHFSYNVYLLKTFWQTFSNVKSLINLSGDWWIQVSVSFPFSPSPLRKIDFIRACSKWNETLLNYSKSKDTLYNQMTEGTQIRFPKISKYCKKIKALMLTEIKTGPTYVCFGFDNQLNEEKVHLILSSCGCVSLSLCKSAWQYQHVLYVLNNCIASSFSLTFLFCLIWLILLLTPPA